MNALHDSISLQRLLSHIKLINLHAFLLLICLAEQSQLWGQHEQKEAIFAHTTRRFSISCLWSTLKDLADDGNIFPPWRNDEQIYEQHKITSAFLWPGYGNRAHSAARVSMGPVCRAHLQSVSLIQAVIPSSPFCSQGLLTWMIHYVDALQ